MGLSDRQPSHFDEDLVSKYDIIEELGGGGMGRVLRARHRQLKQPVAIKLLQNDLKSHEAVTRFMREARAAALIRSPHVAHVMDAGILRNGQPYIVMEYLRGQDLAKLIASEGRLPVERAVDFLLQALEAIAEAHSLQIVHRDIKPGNLFATKIAGGETFIKVVDFGLAKTNLGMDTYDPGVTERGAVLGTPSYMAPEQFVDAQDADVRADVWGLGATLFELLSGVPPFSGASLPQIYTAVMHGSIPGLRSALPTAPEGLPEVIARCLNRERAQRYADVAELAAALEPYAPASGREHVKRIQRIVSGERDLAFDEPTPSVADACHDVDHATRPGTVSSTFARSAWRAAREPTRRSPRWWVALPLLALCVGGWTYGTRRAASTPLTAPPVATHAPQLSVEPTTTTTIAPTTPPPLDASTEVPAAVPPTLGTHAALPKSGPTPKPRVRARNKRDEAPRAPDPVELYERYP